MKIFSNTNNPISLLDFTIDSDIYYLSWGAKSFFLGTNENWLGDQL